MLYRVFGFLTGICICACRSLGLSISCALSRSRRGVDHRQSMQWLGVFCRSYRESKSLYTRSIDDGSIYLSACVSLISKRVWLCMMTRTKTSSQFVWWNRIYVARVYVAERLIDSFTLVSLISCHYECVLSTLINTSACYQCLIFEYFFFSQKFVSIWR